MDLFLVSFNKQLIILSHYYCIKYIIQYNFFPKTIYQNMIVIYVMIIH